jgi:hypothetical protein
MTEAEKDQTLSVAMVWIQAKTLPDYGMISHQ